MHKLSALILAGALVGCMQGDDSVATHGKKIRTASRDATCADLGLGDREITLPAVSGAYDIDGLNTVELAFDYSGRVFTFHSTVRLDGALVPSGDLSAVWDFDGEADALSGLQAPDDDYGRALPPDSVTLCFDYEFLVNGSPYAHFDRRIQWGAGIELGPRDGTYLDIGQVLNAQYSVQIQPLTTAVDSNFTIDGPVFVENPTPYEAWITSLSAKVGEIATPVVCPFALPYKLTPGALVECAYKTQVPDREDRDVVLAVGASGLPPSSATTVASFASHTTQFTTTGRWVELTTPGIGFLGVFRADDGIQHVPFTVPFGPYSTCGYRSVPRFVYLRSFDSPDPTTGEQIWTGDTGEAHYYTDTYVRCP